MWRTSLTLATFDAREARTAVISSSWRGLRSMHFSSRREPCQLLGFQPSEPTSDLYIHKFNTLGLSRPLLCSDGAAVGHRKLQSPFPEEADEG